MSDRFRVRRGRAIVAAALALVVVAGLAAAGTATARTTKSCGTVTLNEQAWAGSTANTYVAKAVLQKIGCKVNITKQKTVIMGGPNGVTGHIGWFIPTYLMKQHPEFKTWKGLKGKESLFKSPESGSQGMFLGGDPSYVQKDKQLIQALKLNLKFVSVGAEPAQVARWSQLYRQHKPVLFYWYTPQYLNKQYQLSEVKLPPRFKGCQDDSKAGGSVAKYKCAYDTIVLNKVFSKKFANGGSPAYGVLKRFKWTNSDQETVAKWIAGDHMNPDKAGKKWVDSHASTVNKWLGK